MELNIQMVDERNIDGRGGTTPVLTKIVNTNSIAGKYQLCLMLNH
jgi:hypothetical protein